MTHNILSNVRSESINPMDYSCAANDSCYDKMGKMNESLGLNHLSNDSYKKMNLKTISNCNRVMPQFQSKIPVSKNRRNHSKITNRLNESNFKEKNSEKIIAKMSDYPDEDAYHNQPGKSMTNIHCNISVEQSSDQFN